MKVRRLIHWGFLAAVFVACQAWCQWLAGFDDAGRTFGVACFIVWLISMSTTQPYTRET